MEKRHFINLLHKKFTGQLEPDEAGKLDHWLKDDVDHRQLASKVEEAWEVSASYEPAFEPSVEQGLGRLKQRMAAAKAADATQTPLKVRTSNKRRLFFQLAAAATLAIGLFGLMQYFSQPTETWKTLATNDDGPQNALLSDGTVVDANIDSYLDFPEQFLGNERRVRLKGEAFFDVARDTEHPFIIELDGASVKVLGTSFNIRSYGDEIELTVKSGSVAFQPDASNKVYQLKAGDQLVFNRLTAEVQTQKDQQLNALAWKRGSLVFIDTKLSEVIRYMEHYYKVDLQLENAKLQNCRFNVNYESTPLAEALEVLAVTYSLDLKQTGPKTYILSRGNCK